MPKTLSQVKLSNKLGGTLFIKNSSAEQQPLQELKTLQQIELTASSRGRVDLLVIPIYSLLLHLLAYR
jgi:hypothetical protein